MKLLGHALDLTSTGRCSCRRRLLRLGWHHVACPVHGLEATLCAIVCGRGDEEAA